MTVVHLPPVQVTLPNWEPPDDDEQLQDFGWAKVELDMSRPEDRKLHKKLAAVFYTRGRSEFRIDSENETIVFRGFVGAMGPPVGITQVQIRTQGFPHLIDKKTGRRKELIAAVQGLTSQ